MRNRTHLIADLELQAEMLSRELHKINKLSEENDLPITDGRLSVADVNKLAAGLVETHEALDKARGETAGEEDLDTSKLSLNEARELGRLMRKAGAGMGAGKGDG